MTPPPDDPRAVLAQLVVRLRAALGTERSAIVNELLPLLGNAGVPLAVRLAAAGRALDALPDTQGAVREVVRAITAGLAPIRALHRLRHLQHLTEKATALDALIAFRERKVKMACPRCGARLTRTEMAKHLWHEHGLTVVRGRTRNRTRALEAIRHEYTATGDPSLFDRAAEVGGEPAIRAWAAETASSEEALPVCRAADERGAGACPKCFADVPPAVPELPPPLALAHGRLAGDGHVVLAPEPLPRVSATVAAAVVLLLVTAAVHIALGFVLAIVAYFVTLVVRIPRRSPDDRAVDAAWKKLSPKLADRRDAARFLTRLCLSSVGRGDPFERANTLIRVIGRARADAAELQLLAAALALQMDDSGRFGRDRASGIADLVALAFRSQHPLAFAEYVLATYATVPRDPGELIRLRVLLHAAAFEAGLMPQDVIDICSNTNHLSHAMYFAPHHVAQLYGVWLNRAARPWAAVGSAQTVFELAATSPATAAKFLATTPNLLLVCDSHPDATAELGPVLITTSHVTVGGVAVSDPAAVVSINDERELIFGTTRLRLERALPESFAVELKAWLRFRAEVPAAYPAMYLPGEPGPLSRLLAPFTAKCPACGTACVPVVGSVAGSLRA